MTLLELLVQELPKRGGWPEWAAAAVQNRFDNIILLGDGYDVNYDGLGWGFRFGNRPDDCESFSVGVRASDHATRIVTREEYEAAVKPMTFEKVRSMLEDVVRQLTDATNVRLDNDGSLNLHFPAGYHVQTPLQRIEQLRKARDEVVRAYNDAFVSGEAELRKLKLGDKIITNSEVTRHDGLVLKLVKIAQFGDGRKDRYVCDFVDEKGNNYDIDNLSTVRFAPL